MWSSCSSCPLFHGKTTYYALLRFCVNRYTSPIFLGLACMLLHNGAKPFMKINIPILSACILNCWNFFMCTHCPRAGQAEGLGVRITLSVWFFESRLRADKIWRKQSFCQIAKCSFEFLSFNEFLSSLFCKMKTVNTHFSVKLSGEVHWIVMSIPPRRITLNYLINEYSFIKLQCWAPSLDKSYFY